MKKIILAVGMLLVILMLGSFSYKVTESMPEQPTNHCTHFTYSCGVEQDICNFTGTTQQLIAHILASDDAICNQEEQELSNFM